jgi:hypothetical protein
MSAYTRLIARQLGLPQSEQEMLQEAAPCTISARWAFRTPSCSSRAS